METTRLSPMFSARSRRSMAASLPGFGFALALSLLLAACGAASADDGSNGASGGVATLAEGAESTDDSSGDETTLTEVADTETQLLAFSACMRENGIDMEDPTVDAEGNVQFGRPQGGGQDGVSREEQRAAQTACAEHLEGIQLGADRPDQTELEDQLLEYTSCMRDNGYDMPDITTGVRGGGDRGGAGDAIDRDDPAYQTAAEACGDVLGGFGARGGGGGPAGGGAPGGADQ